MPANMVNVPGNMMNVPPNAMNMAAYNPWMQPNILLVPFPSPAAWPIHLAAPPVVPPGYQLVPPGEMPATPAQSRHSSSLHTWKCSRQIADMSSDPVSPSVDSPEKMEISFPPMSDWLTGLDSHAIWGQDNQQYSKWIEAFLEDGLLHLDNLHGLEASYYVQRFRDMNMGTARRLKRYAMEDIAKVKKRSRRWSALYFIIYSKIHTNTYKFIRSNYDGRSYMLLVM